MILEETVNDIKHFLDKDDYKNASMLCESLYLYTEARKGFDLERLTAHTFDHADKDRLEDQAKTLGTELKSKEDYIVTLHQIIKDLNEQIKDLMGE